MVREAVAHYRTEIQRQDRAPPASLLAATVGTWKQGGGAWQEALREEWSGR